MTMAESEKTAVRTSELAERFFRKLGFILAGVALGIFLTVWSIVLPIVGLLYLYGVFT